MRRFLTTHARTLRTCVFWLVLSCCGVSLLAAYQYRSGLADLSQRMHGAETLLAEKLAQHDAHLSGLGAVVRMSPQEPSPSIQGLAENIITRYPRITDIETMEVKDQAARIIAYGRMGGSALQPDQAVDILPKLGAIGETAVRPSPVPHSYEIFKLVAPNRILRLRINADALLDLEQDSGPYASVLMLGNTVISAHSRREPAVLTASASAMSSNHSQPMNLTISRGFSLAELLPPQLVFPLLALLAAATWLVQLYREVSRERRRQELRASLLEQEAKLAQAGRINAIGEMASGIAHELAQPIAALLSQSQAARRALAITRPDILEKALEANVREAKRAGDILARMRAYISGAAAQVEKVAVAGAIREALQLVETELAQRGITLEARFSDEVATAMIDVISFQQVIHNLVRNAADAVAGRKSARIVLDTSLENDQVMITISDNGPGIDPMALARIFEPFFTTKPDGMGLGLPLSARLIEKMDGSIEARNDEGASFIIRLPAGAPR